MTSDEASPRMVAHHPDPHVAANTALLRMIMKVLVAKGVLTPDDLDAVETLACDRELLGHPDYDASTRRAKETIAVALGERSRLADG